MYDYDYRLVLYILSRTISNNKCGVFEGATSKPHALQA